jgi:8-oxo-dGTP pyrophosphatase MutT (NUDIX family)
MNSAIRYRSAASVLLIRDCIAADCGIEVLMLQRPGGMSFAHSWVFPGGSLESQDKSSQWHGHIFGLTLAEAANQLQLPKDPHSWWLAAARELFEEAGILLAETKLSEDELAIARAQLLAGTSDFLSLAQEHRWQFDLSALVYQSFWIAPEWVSSRYATRFFVAPMPSGQQASPDGTEAIALQWFRPSEGIARREALKLPRPTLENLKLLSQFESVADALSSLAEGDKSLMPAIWPSMESGEVHLSEVSQCLDGLNIVFEDDAAGAE